MSRSTNPSAVLTLLVRFAHSLVAADSNYVNCVLTLPLFYSFIYFVLLPLHSHLPSSPADLEAKLTSTFDVEKDVHWRVWHRYMTSTYELLSDPNQSLQDAGLYNGQVRVCCWLRGGEGEYNCI